MSTRMECIVGDITKLDVDAIVNAANEAMCGGGGVDGAIHRAAGPGLFEESRRIGHCPEGEARLTRAYLLPARHIIHTVGPVYEGGEFGEAETLASCYRSSLALAEAHGAATIAFPAIGTGAYGYPKAEATKIAVREVAGWHDGHELPRRVVFCCDTEADAATYRPCLVNLG